MHEPLPDEPPATSQLAGEALSPHRSLPAKVFTAGLAADVVLDLVTHGGWPGLIFGGLASALLAKEAPLLAEHFSDLNPLEYIRWGGRSLKDRALGRFAEEEPARPHEAHDEPATPHRSTPEEYALRVQLAPDLALPIDEIAGKAIFIVGQRRSGKTTLGARLAEEVGGHYIPLLIPDLHGDYLSLVDILPRGGIACAPGTHAGADYHTTGVTPQTAHALGGRILAEGLQVVVDLGSYPTLVEACQVVTGIIAGLFTWARQNPGLVVPCEIFLDEAQALLPQDLSESLITDRETLREFLKAYLAVVAEGGKFGLTPVILSQRFAQTNKKLIAQAEIRFILRQTGDNDLERVMDYVNKDTATREQIAGFRQGQGIYLGADGTQLVTRFLPRHSDGSRSHTPKAASAQRYASLPLPTPGPGASAGVSAPFQAFQEPKNGETGGGSRPETHGQATPQDELRSSLPLRETPETASPSRVNPPASGVSEETKQTILRLYHKGLALREIARMVGYAGGKYARFKLACQELGIAPQKPQNEDDDGKEGVLV